MNDQVWWIVTLRVDGDDEDSLDIIEADDEDTAVATATETMQDVTGCKSAEVYINHVVRCVGARPEHVRTAPS